MMLVLWLCMKIMMFTFAEKNYFASFQKKGKPCLSYRFKCKQRICFLVLFVDQRFGINVGGHFFSMLYTSGINGMLQCSAIPCVLAFTSEALFVRSVQINQGMCLLFNINVVESWSDFMLLTWKIKTSGLSDI